MPVPFRLNTSLRQIHAEIAMNMVIASRRLLHIFILLWNKESTVISSFSLLNKQHAKRQQPTNNKPSVPSYFSLSSSFRHDDPGVSGVLQQPPHAGCHFRPTHPLTSRRHKGPRKRKRFFEGWYYRITIPEEDASFAIIVSIEDPFHKTANNKNLLSLSCLQIMGPNDEYLIQADPEDTKFWASTTEQALGCTFESKPNGSTTMATNSTIIDPNNFDDVVESGFQILPTRFQGKLRGQDGTKDSGSLNRLGTTDKDEECDFDFHVQSLAGYGGNNESQKSTGGWLASYSVFDPHWQVTMADGRASGSIRWKNTTYQFQNAPFYAEKNWGGTFPIKWYWCQCNSFTLPNRITGDLRADIPLSVTAGGGTRKIPLGKTESLGLVSVHYNGTLYEGTPWLGDMEWKISPWGYWKLIGRCTQGEKPFYVELEAMTSAPGVKLRAPTLKEGMVFFCKDSFLGNVTLSLWELDSGDNKGKLIIDRAISHQGAVEVGGGPWWDVWEDESRMNRVLKFLVRLPYRWKNLIG